MTTVNINIENEIKEILSTFTITASPQTQEELSAALKELFDSHLERVMMELGDESAYGTIHLHTGKPNQFR